MIFSIFPWFDLPGKMEVPLNLIIILFWLGTPGSIHPIFRPASQPWQQDSQVLLQGNGWKNIWAWVGVHLPNTCQILMFQNCLITFCFGHYRMFGFYILYDCIYDTLRSHKHLGRPRVFVCLPNISTRNGAITNQIAFDIKAQYPGERQKVGTWGTWMFNHPFMWKIIGVEITVLTIPETRGVLVLSLYPNGDSTTGSLISISISKDSQVDGSECLMLRWSHPGEFSSQGVKHDMEASFGSYLLHPIWTYQSFRFILILDTPN